MTFSRIALAAALALMPLLAVAKTLPVGPDKEFKLPSDAIKAADDGDKVLIDAGEYFDCAVVEANNLVIEGAGADGSSIITDKTCGGKAILVTIGDNITVRNLTLSRARVADKNGAGIRAEGTTLTVEKVKFINNQNGILSGVRPDGVTIVRDSDFIRNGICDPACAHGMYIGISKLLRIENSRFSETRQGHHIKSRAARTEIIGTTITDGPNGTASYLIEIPNGGSFVLRDSTLDKGPKADNRSTAISIGAEGVTQATREITITNNRFTNSGRYRTFFVNNLTATDAILKNNKLTGQIDPLKGDGEVQ
ncbi:MAG: hypothetical protein NT133_02515 [Alphaproteobacteria bacterium]|nr:hypothetical protein [Alphaproteobacteria bacterium]